MIRKIGRNDYEVQDANGNVLGYRKTLVDAQLLEDAVARDIIMSTRYRVVAPVVYERGGMHPTSCAITGNYASALDAYRRIIKRGACVAFRYY